MNERIQALAEQADNYAAGIVDQGGRFREAYTTKFVELIIQDCVDIIENSRIDSDKSVCLVGSTKCKIKQHFGVE